MRALLSQLTRFGAVGFVGLIVDVTVFNVLRLTVLSPESLHEGPFIAKVISTTIAIICNWLGNRHWTFRGYRKRHWIREGIEFGIVSVGGMLISLLCLWISHYLLGYDSVLADNLATNVVGLALGTAFRFTLYRTWVFREAEVASDRARLGATQKPASGATEAPVVPAGLAPDSAIKAVSSVKDRLGANRVELDRL